MNFGLKFFLLKHRQKDLLQAAQTAIERLLKCKYSKDLQIAFLNCYFFYGNNMQCLGFLLVKD